MVFQLLQKADALPKVAICVGIPQTVVDGNNFWQVARTWLDQRGWLHVHGGSNPEALPSQPVDDDKLARAMSSSQDSGTGRRSQVKEGTV